jgi:hypothetical protein
MVNANTATAADFDVAAQKHANAFWFYLFCGGIIAWLFSAWWASPAFLLAAFSAVRSIGATQAAGALRNGTYRVANPNNGAPDGDARNY